MRRLALVLLALAPLIPAPVAAQAVVPRYGVFEGVVEATRAFANPWQDATLSVDLAGPGGAAWTIPGFFFGGQQWRFRFSPDVVGRWSWSATLRDTGGAAAGTASGTFTVAASADPGWLMARQSPDPARLVHRDGSLFPAAGIGDCMLDVDGDGTPLSNDWGWDGGIELPNHSGERFGSLDSYLAAYGAGGAGFNLFRFSLDNCAFRVFDAIEPGANRYRERESLWADTIIAKLRANGFRVWFVLFGFSAPFQEGANAQQLDAVRHYVRYAAARWGAMVDLWEVANEISRDQIDPNYIATVADELAKAAPYNRPVTTSFDVPEHPSLTFTGTHWYPYMVDPALAGDVTQRAIEEHRYPRMPLVYGEAGNRGSNWDTESALRMRIKAYTAWFLGASIVWWNTSHRKGYNGNPANLYIGPDERAQNRAFVRFIAQMPADAAPFIPAASFVDPDFGDGRSVRIRGMRSGGSMFVYAENGKMRVSGLTIAGTVSGPAIATWTEPRSGAVLESVFVPSGSFWLRAPVFWEDIALAVVPASKAGHSVVGVALLPR